MEFLQVLGIEKLIFQEETRKKNKESVIDEVYGVDRNTSAYLLISEIKRLKTWCRRRGYKKFIEQFDSTKKQNIDV